MLSHAKRTPVWVLRCWMLAVALTALVSSPPAQAAYGTYYPELNVNYTGRFRTNSIPMGLLEWGRLSFKENISYAGCSFGKRYFYSYRNGDGWTEFNVEIDLCNPQEKLLVETTPYTEYLWRRVDNGNTCTLSVYPPSAPNETFYRDLLHWNCSNGNKQVARKGVFGPEKVDITITSPRRRLVRGDVGSAGSSPSMCVALDTVCSCGDFGLECFKQRRMQPVTSGVPGPTFRGGNLHSDRITQANIDGPHMIIGSLDYSFRNNQTAEWTNRFLFLLSSRFTVQWAGQFYNSLYRHSWNDDPGSGFGQTLQWDFDYGSWVKTCLELWTLPGTTRIPLLTGQFVSTVPGGYWCAAGQTTSPCTSREYEVDYDIQCSYFGPG